MKRSNRGRDTHFPFQFQQERTMKKHLMTKEIIDMITTWRLDMDDLLWNASPCSTVGNEGGGEGNATLSLLRPSMTGKVQDHWYK